MRDAEERAVRSATGQRAVHADARVADANVDAVIANDGVEPIAQVIDDDASLEVDEGESEAFHDGICERRGVPSAPRGRYLIGTVSSGTESSLPAQCDTAPITTKVSAPGSRLAVRKFLYLRTGSHGPSPISSSTPSAGTTSPPRTTTPYPGRGRA